MKYPPLPRVKSNVKLYSLCITINDSTCLEGYYENIIQAQQHLHRDSKGMRVKGGTSKLRPAMGTELKDTAEIA